MLLERNISDAIVANTAKTGITAVQADAIVANTAKTGITAVQAESIVANTDKVGVTDDLVATVTSNTAKTGITAVQADAIETNTTKISFPGFGVVAGTALEGNTELPNLEGDATENWVTAQGYASTDDTDANTAAIATNAENIDYNAGEIVELANPQVACSTQPGLTSLATGLGGDFGGSDNVCALKNNGTVSCWGRCDDGRCGDGLIDNHKNGLPSSVLTISDATLVTMGENHGCAIRGAWELSCWGRCDDGRCGDGDIENHRVGLPISVLGISDAVDADAGPDFTCAAHASGSGSCWGRCDDGRCGDGDASNHIEGRPVTVQDLDDVVGVATGAAGFVCAVPASGSVSCWGRCDDGQCGDGDTSNHSEGTPVTVQNLDDAVAIAPGQNHVCALRETGEVVCWGRCDDGRCGDGSTDNHLEGTPVSVLNINTATALNSGSDYSCAVLADGTISCWGRCDDGRCGDGNAENHKVGTPVATLNIDSAVEVTAGYDSTCAVLSNGDAVCWGRCDDGRCGDGDIDNHKESFPVSVESVDFAMCY